jgi:predicted methyltransferase
VVPIIVQTWPLPRRRAAVYRRAVFGHSQRARAVFASIGLCVSLATVSSCKRGGTTDKPAEHHYDDKEAALAHFEEPERDAWAMPGKVIEMLEITPAMDIADIGAGSGYFTRRLATAASNGTTWAVDVDADFKGHIESHRAEWGTPNIETRLAVYEHPLLPRDTVDLVFISNTYSFLQDRAAYFTAVYKALRRGGRLAVIDWRHDVECPRQLGCPKVGDRIPADTAITELEQVGFVVLARHDFLPYQYFLILGRAADRASEPEPTPAEPAEPAPAATEPPG